ncbi:hypothetical protein DYI42_23315 [Vannielia litorea]|nr:hypothetical protein [Vannielia litorea]
MKCPQCKKTELPRSDKEWAETGIHHCPVCGARFKRGRVHWALTRMLSDVWGWALGISVVTLGLGLLVALPIVAIVYLVRAFFPRVVSAD